MSGITRSIEEMVADNPNVDTRETFDRLWALTGEMFEQVQERFELSMDPCCSHLQPYTGLDSNGAEGHIGAYSGPEVDWLIHSWTGNPEASFTNMHLTIGLGPQIDVPHFGFALGTIPDLFWYMDYMPRKELITNPEYADMYYGGDVNNTFIDMDRNENFSPFISRDMYARVAQTPCSVCVGAPTTAENLETLREMCLKQLDRWLAWVDAAEPVPFAERAALAERDLMIRRTICERDPANIVVDRLFGEELGDYLVKTLWGGTRTLPRPFVN